MLEPLLQKQKNLSYRNGLLILGSIYVVLVIAYLIQYQGLPYVFDNNESFSSIIHAKNLLQFDFLKSFGLTDESYGVIESAHPYVYTHQGNFPRLFAAFLYLLGLKSIQSQIIAHVITINTLALYFAYTFFAKKIAPIFALIYCLILLTDYVMHFQWQFNTWRVWHCFFMFSSLLLIEKYKTMSNKIYIPLIFLNFSCLAYFEMTFAVFISILSAGMLIFQLKKPKLWFYPISLVFTGVFLGFSVLIIQTIFYYHGLDGFLNDLRLTFIARNYSIANPFEFAAMTSQIWNFVDAQKLVFWDNFVLSSANLRSLFLAIQLYFKYNLMIYSPFLILVLLTFNAVFVCKFIAYKFEDRPIFKSEKHYLLTILNTRSNTNKIGIAVLMLGIVLFIALKTTIVTHIDIHQYAISKASIFVTLFIFIILTAWVWRGPRDASELSVRLYEVLIIIALTGLLLGFGLINHKLFESLGPPIEAYEILWKKILFFDYFRGAAPKIIWCLSLLTGVFILLNQRFYQLPKEAKRIVNLVPFVISGFLAWGICWWLVPGYILSGYYMRYAPLFEYNTILFMVIPIYLLSLLVKDAIARITQEFSLTQDALIKAIKNSIQVLPLTIVFLFIIGTWVGLQTIYFKEFKTTDHILLEKLATPRFQFASIAANTYAAPFAVQTNQWAYFSPTFSSGRINRTNDGYFYEMEDKYIWLSDKEKNNAYKNPDYFICFLQANYDFLVGFNPRCDIDIPLIKNLTSGVKNQNFSDLIDHKLIDSDPSGSGRWAIVALDNDFPPFLALKNNPRFINILDTSNGIRIDYQYQQQFKKAEENSVIKLYRLNSCNQTNDPKLIFSTTAPTIALAHLGTGTLQVSVTPKSTTKYGETFWSEPFSMAGSTPVYCGHGIPIESPLDIEVKSNLDGRRATLSWRTGENVRYFEVQKSLDGQFFTGITLIDGEKRDLNVGPVLDAQQHFIRIRGCTDWACSPWSTHVPALKIAKKSTS